MVSRTDGLVIRGERIASGPGGEGATSGARRGAEGGAVEVRDVDVRWRK